jgi:hypothetical protein
MSFFGFDTNLPKEKPGANKGVFEHNDPFAGIAQARKLQAFQADDEEEYDIILPHSIHSTDQSCADSTSKTPMMGLRTSSRRPVMT